MSGGVWRFFRVVAPMYPLRSLVVLVCFLLGSLAEGIGVATVLPLLGLVIGEGQSAASALSLAVRNGLAYVGLAPTVGVLLVIIVVTMFLKSGLFLLAMTQAGFAAAHVASDLRLGLIRSLMRAQWGYFITQRSGAFANALATEPARSGAAYVNLCRFSSEIVLTTVYASLALIISWEVTVAAVACGCVSAGLLVGLVRMGHTAGARLTELLKSLAARLIDGLQGIKMLKAMACENLLEPFLRKETQGLKRAEQRYVVASHGLGTMQEPIMILALAGGIYVAITFWKMPFDTLMVLGLLFWRTIDRIAQMQRNYQIVRGDQSAFWSLKSAIAEAEAAREVMPSGRTPTLEQEVVFDRVTFSHGDKQILSAISLSMPAKSLTALVGPSGAGKTTITDLLIGLFRPDSGTIFLDGVPLSAVDLRSWRRMIGYVPQETILFHESIFVNVTLGEPSLTRDQAEAALRAAGAWDFVRELEAGLDTVAGERGAKLSGGQRQRIAIARALVREPKLLILDEVTAALDPQTEAAICATLRELSRSRTILAISHQPAIVETADVVYRLENGTVQREENGGK